MFYVGRYYDHPMCEQLSLAFDRAMCSEHWRCDAARFYDGFMLVYCMGGEL